MINESSQNVCCQFSVNCCIYLKQKITNLNFKFMGMGYALLNVLVFFHLNQDNVSYYEICDNKLMTSCIDDISNVMEHNLCNYYSIAASRIYIYIS